jgi:hypothetical protein
MKVRTKGKEKNGHMKYHRGGNINIDTSMNFDCELWWCYFYHKEKFTPHLFNGGKYRHRASNHTEHVLMAAILHFASLHLFIYPFRLFLFLQWILFFLLFALNILPLEYKVEKQMQQKRDEERNERKVKYFHCTKAINESFDKTKTQFCSYI